MNDQHKEHLIKELGKTLDALTHQIGGYCGITHPATHALELTHTALVTVAAILRGKEKGVPCEALGVTPSESLYIWVPEANFNFESREPHAYTVTEAMGVLRCKVCGLECRSANGELSYRWSPGASRTHEPRAQEVPELPATSRAMQMIYDERDDQRVNKGFDDKRDDRYTKAELVRAGESYIEMTNMLAEFTPAEIVLRFQKTLPMPFDWPWDDKLLRPSADPVKNLQKAGALFLAEIERLSRRVEWVEARMTEFLRLQSPKAQSQDALGKVSSEFEDTCLGDTNAS